jgi:uncharacterized protein (UPF0332 family)
MRRLAEPLLDLSKKLAELEPTKPRQASLRRAVSTGYYALFHLLVHAAVARMFPDRAEESLRDAAARRFSHTGIKLVLIAARQAPSHRRPEMAEVLGLDPPSTDLDSFCASFLGLQAARETADYDAAAAYKRSEVVTQLQRAANAFELWNGLRRTPEGQRLILALIVHGRTRPL